MYKPCAVLFCHRLSVLFCPPISNETITLVKDTSLVYVLAMNDLMRTARNLVQRDFNIMPLYRSARCFLSACYLSSDHAL